ncbi:MAG: hypothetical protein L0Y70_14315 [Gemmataceae bacterium]|nr:hypothetical protein [Gemmataceae bacterium]
MSPVVRYMLLCDDVHKDPKKPSCTHIDCLMGNIVSLEDPPFPLLREKVCIYLALTEGHGRGVAQIRVAYVDSEPEQLLFGSPEHDLDFTGHSPLELLGVVFRLKDCPFPQAGRSSVQFWYNHQKVEECPLRLKASKEGNA